jgi:hypothetical protein
MSSTVIRDDATASSRRPNPHPPLRQSWTSEQPESTIETQRGRAADLPRCCVDITVFRPEKTLEPPE